MPSAKINPYRASRTQQVIIWGDLFLVDFAPVVPWIGFVIGQIFSPILGRSLGISSDIAFAIIVACSTIIGSYLLIRMLQKRRPASPAYLRALSEFLGPVERRNYDDRMSWLLKRARPITRADAINTYCAAQKDMRLSLERKQLAAVFAAQKSMMVSAIGTK